MTAAGFADISRCMHDVPVRQLGRQRAALLLLRNRCPISLSVRRRRLQLGRWRCRSGLGLRRLRLLQRKLELGDGTLDALGARAELLRRSLAICAFSVSMVS